MGNDREIELKSRHEEELKNKRLEWEVEDALGLSEISEKWCLCLHKGKELDSHFSVMLRSSSYPCSYNLRSVMRILREVQERHGVLSVPRWAEPGFSPYWAPDECNFSRLKEGSVQKGTYEVELTSHGNARYHGIEFAFWTRVEGCQVPLCEIQVEVGRLPTAWMSFPKFVGFSQQDGRCTSMSLSPPSGLPGAVARVGLGAPDSWRSEYYWETTDKFLQEAGKLPS